MADVNDLVAAYVKIRDKKQEIQEQHKQQLAPYNDKLMMLEGTLLKVLNREGAESIRTDSGTCFKSKRTTTKVVDWDEALNYILSHDLTHMLERRLSKAAVVEFAEAQGELPPGVTMNTELTVNIRRK